MTVQSMHNGEPRGAATVSGLMETDGLTSQDVYRQIKDEALSALGSQIPNREIGRSAVVMYVREENEPADQRDLPQDC